MHDKTRRGRIFRIPLSLFLTVEIARQWRTQCSGLENECYLGKKRDRGFAAAAVIVVRTYMYCRHRNPVRSAIFVTFFFAVLSPVMQI